MRNLRLDIAYDGTDFHGWQRQPEKPTIQGCVEAAIGQITGEKVKLTGAGRTDAGVHAAGQVANFGLANSIPCENLNGALNRVLPETVRILRVWEAQASFHARYDAAAKVYRYRILLARICPPYLARFVYHYPGRLDLQAMRQAAAQIEGEHDFTSFAASDPHDPKRQKDAGEIPAVTTRAVREIFASRLTWRRHTSILTYEIRGSGFLRYMVRNIVGTLIETGRGALRAGEIPEILAARDRSKAGPAAPARGLCLVRVEY